MNAAPAPYSPPLALGATSVILGSVGLLLFFLPILGIPLGGVGLLLGLAGVLLAIVGGPSSLRWSAAGTAVSALALGLDWAIALAPLGYLSNETVPPNTTPPAPNRPYVSPPARILGTAVPSALGGRVVGSVKQTELLVGLRSQSMASRASKLSIPCKPVCAAPPRTCDLDPPYGAPARILRIDRKIVSGFSHG